MRIFALVILIVGARALLPAAEPSVRLAPTEITWKEPDTFLGKVPSEFAKQSQSGVQIVVAPNARKAKFDANFDKTPFWEALQTAADKTETRISLSSGGQRVNLELRGKSREVAAASGAFRVVAQQVVGRALLDLGVTYHEVHLLAHWEPRIRVYRIDSAPKCKATDVPGSKINVEAGHSQILPLNSTSEMKVKLFGLTRDSGRITSLAGEFEVIAADKLLAFSFASDGKLPVEKKEAGVTATLKRVQKKEDTWEVEVEAMYPEGQPTFQSFEGEWWLRDNRLLVVSGGKPVAVEDYEIPRPDNPRPLRAIYRFKENAKAGLVDPTKQGVSIVYETPSPLMKKKVTFELKDIPLP